MLKKALVTCTAGVAVAMFAAAAHAGVVDCTTSSASQNDACVTICPVGDSETLVVSLDLVDAFNNDVVGFPADSIEIECPGLVNCPGATPGLVADAATAGDGTTTITYSAGGFNQDGSCDLVNVTIHNGPNTCTLDVPGGVGGANGVSLRFFDLTGDCVVGPSDFGKLAGHWLQSGPAHHAADYNCDDTVGPSDFGSFAGHWLHSNP